MGTIDVAPYRAPHGAQRDASGTIYVTSDLDRKLIAIDPKARTIAHAIDTGGTTHWIGILPNGTTSYATTIAPAAGTRRPGRTNFANGPFGLCDTGSRQPILFDDRVSEHRPKRPCGSHTSNREDG